MPNRVTLDSDGIIRSYLEGDQDESTVSHLISRTAELLKKQGNQSAPTKFLVDMTNVGAQTLSARKVGFKAMTTMSYHKIAIVGSNRFIKHTVSLLIMASGDTDKIQQFDDEAAALRWLNRS